MTRNDEVKPGGGPNRDFHLDMFKNKLQKTAIFGTFCAILNCRSSDDDQFTRLGSKKS